MEAENSVGLSVEDCCRHKDWRVRQNGYSSLARIFAQNDANSRSVLTELSSSIANFVDETNAPALDEALKAVDAYVVHCPDSAEKADDVVPRLVSKCLSSSRRSTAECALTICRSYAVKGRRDFVLKEILDAIVSSKSPKMTTAYIKATTTLIEEFGYDATSTDVILSTIKSLFDNRDQNVRNEAKICASKIEAIKNDSKVQFSIKNDEKPAAQNVKPVRTFVDILAQIPAQFASSLKSSKWSERRDALLSLEKLLSMSSPFKNGDYASIVKSINDVIINDVNVAVVSLAVKCANLLADGLGPRFIPYASSTCRTLLFKLRDGKRSIVDNLREALNVVTRHMPSDQMIAETVGRLKDKNPNVKMETALFLSRAFVDKKVEYWCRDAVETAAVALVDASSDSDPNVRNAVLSALAAAYAVVPEELSPFLSNVDDKKRAKIRDLSRTCRSSSEIMTISSNVETIRKTGVNSSEKSTSQIVETSLKNAVISDVMNSNNPNKKPNMQQKTPTKTKTSTTASNKKKTDVNFRWKFEDEFVRGLSDKNWSVRLKTISKIQDNLTSVDKVNSSSEFWELLAARICDSNSKIASAAINLIPAFAVKSGKSGYALKMLPLIVKSLGDSKTWVRESSSACMTSLSRICGIKAVLDSDAVADGLQSGPLSVRVRLSEWISTELVSVSGADLPEEAATKCLYALLSSLEDRNAEVRRNSLDALGVLSSILGSRHVLSTCETLFEGRNSVIKLVKERCFRIGNESIDVKHSSSKAKGQSKPSPEGKQLVQVNNRKFPLTNGELINEELLETRINDANFHEEFTFLMLADDPEYCLEATQLLLNKTKHNLPVIVSNLELVFTWICRQIVEFHPQLIEPLLTLCFTILNALVNTSHVLHRDEVAILVPCLISKLDDQFSHLHPQIKVLIQQTFSLYPEQDMAQLIMDSAESLTSSVKRECLCLLGNLNKQGDADTRNSITCADLGISSVLKASSDDGDSQMNFEKEEPSERSITSQSFSIDDDFQEEIERVMNTSSFQANLLKVDLDFLQENTGYAPSHEKSSMLKVAVEESSLVDTLREISNDNVNVAVDALRRLDCLLRTDKKYYLLRHTSHLIRAIVLKLRRNAEYLSVEHRICLDLIFVVLVSICDDADFLRRFSRDNLFELVEQLLLLIARHKSTAECQQLLHSVNLAILKILDNAMLTDAFCSLLRLVRDTMNQGDSKLHILSIKCLWKLCKRQPGIEGLDAKEILSSVNDILKFYSYHWWKLKGGDAVVRTMKTILRLTVRTTHERILDDLKTIQCDDFGLGRYVQKLFRHFRGDFENHHLTLEPTPKSDENVLLKNRQIRELARIFQVMTSNSCEGLRLLRQFVALNPNVASMLDKASPRLALFLNPESSELATSGLEDVWIVEDTRRLWEFFKSRSEPICGSEQGRQLSYP